jgi:RNA polymerase sigma-70 factor, ECF subfamily
VLPRASVTTQAALIDSLLDRIQGGDVRAEETLIRELYPVVQKHLSFLLRFHPSVEDAVQEAMVEIYRSLPRLRYRESVRAWALKIATRRARRYQRSQDRHTAALTRDGALPEVLAGADPESRADLVELVTALDTLHPKKREAFIMMEILEMSAREAAEAIGIPANTAASRCRHAKEELSRRFGEGNAP